MAMHLEGANAEMAAPPVKLLLTVDEAAAALSLGRTFTCRLIAAGQIASVKVGARRLIPVTALQAFVERLIAA